MYRNGLLSAKQPTVGQRAHVYMFPMGRPRVDSSPTQLPHVASSATHMTLVVITMANRASDKRHPTLATQRCLVDKQCSSVIMIYTI